MMSDRSQFDENDKMLHHEVVAAAMSVAVVTGPEGQYRFAFVLLYLEVVDLAKVVRWCPQQASAIIKLSLKSADNERNPYVAS